MGVLLLKIEVRYKLFNSFRNFSLIQENLDNNARPALRKNITIHQSTLFNAVSVEANDRYDRGLRIGVQ
jgi:hypothetical protein